MSDPAAMARIEEAARAFSQGRFDEAARQCRNILRRHPTHVHALHLSAVVALQRGEAQQAVDFATRALKLQPGDAQILGHRGAALRKLGRYDEALADYDAALAGAPDAADVRSNRGVALAALGRHEEAIDEYRRAVCAAPRFADALYNLGVSLGALNRHAEAVAAYSQTLEASPDHVHARWNRALSRLALGDLRGGFADYEARNRLGDSRATPRHATGMRWDGRQSVAGKRIVLLAEQGFGDCILFSRFARVLRALGARILLEAPPPLVALLEQLPYVERVIPTTCELPDCDLYCPIASVPGLLGTTLETLPPQQPALVAPAASIARWSAQLGAVRRPCIGIAWSGGTGASSLDPRAIPLALWAELRQLPATFVALQKQIPAADRAFLEHPRPLLHFEDQIEDFRDTAALAQLVDVVVTIDTAVAHLAGAMGRPTLVALPFAADWRWLLDREDSPWYPSARLVRQARQGDWMPVIRRLAHELHGYLG